MVLVTLAFPAFPSKLDYVCSLGAQFDGQVRGFLIPEKACTYFCVT